MKSLPRTALAALLLVAFSACGGTARGSPTAGTGNPPQGPTQQGWLGRDATSVTFLQWMENPDHTLAGEVTQFSTNPGDTFSAAITGAHRGSDVRLSVSVLGASYTATGTLTGSVLSLNLPQPDGTIETESFSRATVARYDQEVISMQHRLTAVAVQVAATADAATADVQATEASAVAAATSTALARAAKVAATEQTTCAAINGHVDSKWGWCASNVPGDPSGQPGSDCSLANVAFNSDGTLERSQIQTSNLFYPGCFPDVSSVSRGIAP